MGGDANAVAGPAGPPVPEVAIACEDPSSPMADALLAAYRDELDGRFAGGFQPPPNWAAARERLLPPGGAFLVLRAGGEPLGCGAVRVLEPGLGEIKHMWLHRSLRGRGLGRCLLAACEAAARELGCTVVRLDTDAVLAEAVQLYRAVGYREIPRYNENAACCAIFMERSLGGAA